MNDGTSVLVVSATAEEAAGVPEGLPLLVTGIGKVAAAVAVAVRLASRPRGTPPPLVVNIGTCGALRPHLRGLFLPSSVVNHDLDVASLARLGLVVSATFSLPGGDGTVLATGDTFVTDEQQARELAEQASLVDMEGYAIAAACAAAGAPCLFVKHVSDTADESAWDWNDAVAASARALGEWLREELPACTEAAGVPVAV
ncbi:MAG: nucleosidase [Kineosporiaceae bacterium]